MSLHVGLERESFVANAADKRLLVLVGVDVAFVVSFHQKSFPTVFTDVGKSSGVLSHVVTVGSGFLEILAADLTAVKREMTLKNRMQRLETTVTTGSSGSDYPHPIPPAFSC